MADLAVAHLTVSYQRLTVLEDVTLEAPGASVTGLIGPNGAGKSTLLKAIVGLVPRDRGDITVDGQALDTWRSRIAYLPQRPAIDWDYPAQVRDMVGMGRYPHRRWRRLRRQDRDIIADCLDRVGMRSAARTQIGELSGGQQQRVLVARALAQEAEVLLLDEPFVGVDTYTKTVLYGVLREAASRGATVVLVNHDLATARTLCDRVVLLSRRVIAAGTGDEVLDEHALDAAYGLGTRDDIAIQERG